MTALLNRVARIAAGTVRAPVAIISIRRDRKLCMLAAHGIYLKKFDESWCMGPDLIRRQNMSYVANVARDTNFRGHPLLKAAPFARSLAHIPVQGQHSDIEAAITIINPEIKWPFSAAVSAILTDLAMLIGDALKASELQDGRLSQMSAVMTPGLRESSHTPALIAGTKDTAGQFLMSTLTHRTSIRNRADVSYVTLRTWSKSIKDHQLSALKIVKADADSKFVDDVASEMAAHVRKLFGVPRVGCVVPVPCGHSRTPHCLSVLITQQLAKLLDVPYVDALEHSVRAGSSHPSKNKTMKMPKLLTDASHESVLLVDDVATSGRHIELAVQSLRQRAQHVTAIAWIGAA